MQNVGKEAALYCLDGLVLFQVGPAVSADDPLLRWSILCASVCSVLWSFGTVHRAYAALQRVADEASRSLSASELEAISTSADQDQLESLSVKRITEVTRDGKVASVFSTHDSRLSHIHNFATSAGLRSLPMALFRDQYAACGNPFSAVQSRHEWCCRVPGREEHLLRLSRLVRHHQVRSFVKFQQFHHMQQFQRTHHTRHFSNPRRDRSTAQEQRTNQGTPGSARLVRAAAAANPEPAGAAVADLALWTRKLVAAAWHPHLQLPVRPQLSLPRLRPKLGVQERSAVCWNPERPKQQLLEASPTLLLGLAVKIR